MNSRTLGADLNVSAIGLGCMGFSHAYGPPTEDDEAIQAIRTAFDMGYTMFDMIRCSSGTRSGGALRPGPRTAL